MTIYVKPAVRSAWAQNAGAADLTDPGDSYAAAGILIGVKPPRQYFNWLENFNSNAVRYLCQNGIVDYDAAETYQTGSVVMGPDFLVYQSIVANNLGHTPSTSPTFWGPLLTATATAGDNTNKTATTAFVTANFLAKTALLSTISGQLVAGQVPVGVVTQWQGSLSLTFPQITGTIAAGQVPVGAVTQWQASLSIAWGQLTGTKNADQLLGLVPGPSSGFSGGTLARYDPSGYLYAGYFNQASANNENPTVSQFVVTNGADNFFRKASLAAVLAAMNASPSYFEQPNGYVKIPGTPIIVQWGSIAYSGSGGTLALTFPNAFPSGMFTAVFTPSVGGFSPGIQGFTRFGVTMSMNNLGGTAQTFFWIAVGH